MRPDGYPDDEELERIRTWDYRDLLALFRYIEERWWAPEYFRIRTRKYKGHIRAEVHTVGWSGNESLIDALMENTMAWMLCWESSERGGHYMFRIPALGDATS